MVLYYLPYSKFYTCSFSVFGKTTTDGSMEIHWKFWISDNSYQSDSSDPSESMEITIFSLINWSYNNKVIFHSFYS